LTLVRRRVGFGVAETAETFFARAQRAQSAWQPFLLRSGGPVRTAELVLRAPEFLNLKDEPHVSFCAAASVAALSGSRSEILCAVDEAGRVFIVACPDETQAEPYVDVAADVLAASGRLWRMSYDNFDELFEKAAGRHLDEIVMPKARPAWDFDVFKPAVEHSLEQGRFPTLVLTSRPGGAVGATLTYLGGMNVQAKAAGVLFEERGGIEVAMPVPAGGFRREEVAAGARAAAGQAAGVREPEAARPAQRPLAARLPEPAPPAAEGIEPEPKQDIPAGAMPTHPAKKVAKPPGPGTKPGVMAGPRPAPARPEEQ
jgi:hypothetical protein